MEHTAGLDSPSVVATVGLGCPAAMAPSLPALEHTIGPGGPVDSWPVTVGLESPSAARLAVAHTVGPEDPSDSPSAARLAVAHTVGPEDPSDSCPHPELGGIGPVDPTPEDDGPGLVSMS